MAHTRVSYLPTATAALLSALERNQMELVNFTYSCTRLDDGTLELAPKSSVAFPTANSFVPVIRCVPEENGLRLEFSLVKRIRRFALVFAVLALVPGLLSIPLSGGAVSAVCLNSLALAAVVCLFTTVGFRITTSRALRELEKMI